MLLISRLVTINATSYQHATLYRAVIRILYCLCTEFFGGLFKDIHTRPALE